MSIRCFIAIELNEGIRRRLVQLQDRLRNKMHHPSGITWVKHGRMHLTLKFLGEVDDAAINDICSAVSQAAALSESFDFELGNCGCFGSPGSARVLWVGITDGQNHLENLHRAVDKHLSLIGFPPERRKFSAHLTLARIRNVKAGRLIRPVVDQMEPATFGIHHVNQITVFQSDLSSGGPVYTPLHHAPLK